MAFFVLDENNNKVEALDKEGVVAAIAQAIEDGSISNLVADAGFISKIKCCISGETLRMAFVTQAYMNTLLQDNAADDNTIYYIIDDTSADDLDIKFEDVDLRFENIESDIRSIRPKLRVREETTNGTSTVIEKEGLYTFALEDSGKIHTGSIYVYDFDQKIYSTCGKVYAQGGYIMVEKDNCTMKNVGLIMEV